MLCRCACYKVGGVEICGACTEFNYLLGVVSFLVSFHLSSLFRDFVHENIITTIMLLFFKHFMELNLIVFGMVDLCCNVGLIGELNVVMGGHDQIEE
jgi:hypothetical protein